MMRVLSFALGALVVGLLAGCSDYVEDFNYGPRPALAAIPATQPQEAPPLTAMAAVIGVHHEDDRLGIPESVEVRLRLENGPGQSATFSPLSMQLLSGDLTKFPPPVVRPAEPIMLAPGQAAMVTAYFPFPERHSYDDMDMDSLQVRWQVPLAGRTVEQVTNFRRTPNYYYYDSYGYGPDPYWYGPGPYYGGVVVVRRHWWYR